MARFLLFLIPQSISLFGSSVLQFAIIWSIVYSYGSGTMLLLSAVLGFVPQILSSCLVGPTLDRRSKKAAIIASDGISALAAAAAMPFLSTGGDASVLLPRLAIRSFCQGVQTPAVNAVLPLLAPNGRLAMANGLRGFLSSIVMLLSPAAAGLLFPLDGGLELSLALDISTALAAMAALSLQAIPDIRGEGRVDMKGAARYVKSDRYLLFLLVFNAAASFAISPGAFMTPLLLQREYWASPSMLSISEMSYSIGMVAGGCIATIAGESMRQRRGYASALMAYGICLVLIGLVHSFPLYLLLNALIGISTPIYGALLNARVQERTEEGMLGRVMALLSASSSAALPLGMVLFGPLGDAIPIRSVFALSGAAAAFLSVLGLRRA